MHMKFNIKPTPTMKTKIENDTIAATPELADLAATMARMNTTALTDVTQPLTMPELKPVSVQLVKLNDWPII